MGLARPVLRVGDRVVFDGDEHQVVGLSGTSVRLRADSGVQQVVLAGHLMAAADFTVLESTRECALGRNRVDELKPSGKPFDISKMGGGWCSHRCANYQR